MSETILGISAFYHDSAACVVRDGAIVAAAQEERFSRVKHDHRFPSSAIEFCLAEAGIAAADLTGVAFYDKPWLKFERLLETYLAFAPKGIRSFMKSMPLWLKEKLWMEDTLRRSIEYDGTVYYPEHHQSHAASAYFPSPFESAAIITLDGVGEWATATWGRGSGNRIELSHELRFPHSLGLLYSAFTYYTGFRVNSGEYKLMGLAPYGNPTFSKLIFDKLLDLKSDGSFRLDLQYFDYCTGLRMTNEKFDDLFGGPPRVPESPMTQREMDLAASVQLVVEEIVIRMAKHVRSETGESNLCLAGGVALNCVANGKLQREKVFDKIWIQPAAGDAGGALGSALFTAHHVFDRPRRVGGTEDTQSGSLLGPSYNSSVIRGLLDERGFSYTHVPDRNVLAARIAECVDDGLVVGLFAGRMEFGPRALGGRSIIGDPRRTEMQSVMNLKIKYRESFRPFAPVCMREHVSDYFDLDAPSPYMLLVAPVAAGHRIDSTESGLTGFSRRTVPLSDVPAITHVDGSARVQTVGPSSDTLIRKVLEAFYERTVCPLLINTSFNVRGEPIVCTPEDAIRCFMDTEMDALVLEDTVLFKSEQKVAWPKHPRPSAYELD